MGLPQLHSTLYLCACAMCTQIQLCTIDPVWGYLSNTVLCICVCMQCQKLANISKMANFQLTPPEPFNFSSPKDWPHWIRWYERFRQASDRHQKSNESQVNNLIFSMGDQADDILRSFGLSEEEMKNYTIVKGKFEGTLLKGRIPHMNEQNSINGSKKVEKQWTASSQNCTALWSTVNTETYLTR